MITYFGMILVPAIFALVWPRSKNIFLFLIIFLLYVILIGYREHIGMDWNNYLAIHSNMRYLDLGDILFDTEAASNTLFWFSNQYYSGIYTSNLVSAMILMIGVLVFSGRTAEPWLSVLAATPYICIVVGMSATRQAMAVGIVFAVFALWHEYGLVRKGIAIFAASLFHTSAIFIGGFLIQDLPLNFAVKLIVGSVVVVAGVYFLSRAGIYSEQIDFYTESYLSTEGQIASPGALAHVALVAIPAVIYFFVRHRIYAMYERSGFLDMSALICIVLVPTAFVFSTAASRFSIYMQFFPMIFYPLLVDTFRTEDNRILVRVAVSLLCFVFLFVWLRFANNSFAYLPYRNLLWD